MMFQLPNKKYAGLALGGAVALGGGMPALGSSMIVWDVHLNTTEAYPDNSFKQPQGDAIIYGDNVHLQPGTPRHLGLIDVPMSLFGYSTSYTPTDLRAMVYNVDGSGLPTTTIATVNADPITFNPSFGYRPGIYNVLKTAHFDFNSLNITLPDNFAFGIYDYTTPQTHTQLSVWAESADSVDLYGDTPVGGANTTPRKYLADVSPTGWVLRDGGDSAKYNFVATIYAPEPASMTILAAGASLVMIRRRRA